MIAGPYHAANRRVVVTLNPSGPPNPPPDTLDRRLDRCLKLLETHKIPADSDGKRTGQVKGVLGTLRNRDAKTSELFVHGMKRHEVINGKLIEGGLVQNNGVCDPPP
jgi:hypothetical protein